MCMKMQNKYSYEAFTNARMNLNNFSQMYMYALIHGGLTYLYVYVLIYHVLIHQSKSLQRERIQA